MEIIFTQPTQEQIEAASKENKEWRPIYNNGIINHYRLTTKKGKGCNCGNN